MKQWNRSIGKQLGGGYDGLVLGTDQMTAIKILSAEPLYRREKAVYLRLQERNIAAICGYTIPRLINYDDRLLVIEMTIVSPPFVVDFASANLDFERKLDPDLRAEWLADKQEQFEDDWKSVKMLIWRLGVEVGVYLNDVHPGNVRSR